MSTIYKRELCNRMIFQEKKWTDLRSTALPLFNCTGHTPWEQRIEQLTAKIQEKESEFATLISQI